MVEHPNADAMKNILRDWLEESRAAYAIAVRKLGLPAVYKMPIPVVEMNEEGTGFSTSYEYEEFNILRVPRFPVEIYDIIELPDLEKLKPPAEFLYSQYGERCKYFVFISPLPSQITGVYNVNFDDDPATWIIHYIFGECLAEYVRECPSISKPPEELLSRVVDLAFEFPAVNLIDTIDVLPVAGFINDSPLTYENVTLRPLTAREMGKWSLLPNQVESFPGQPNLHVHAGLFPFLQPTHALEIRTRVDKSVQPEEPHFAQRFFLASQLLGFEPASYSSGERIYYPAWGYFGRIKSPIPTGLSNKFSNKEIDQQIFKAAYELTETINEAAVTIPSSAQDIALHRFNLALTREKEIDALIDLTISLEALLLPRVRDELRFRFRLHGSLWLSEEPEDRRKLFDESLKYIYDMRSTVVHGGQFPTPQALRETVTDAKELARKALFKAMTSGWPTANTFADLYLTGK